MAKIKGVCKNIGEECSKALNKEVQEVEKAAPFICEECEKPLIKVDGKSAGKGSGGNKNILIIIIAAVVLIGGGAGAYFAFFNKSSDKKTTTEIPQDPPKGGDEPKEVNIQSIALDKANLDMLIGGTDTLKTTVSPAEAKSEGLEWTSEDAEVATVENGVVKAVSKGETTVILKDSKGSATAQCRVKVSEPEKDNKVNPAPEGGSGQISYGRWTGGSKNGKPHGTQITFTFTTSHQIDSRDPKKRIASAGDYIIGEYDNGRLVQGRWYKKSGGFESIMIGK